MSSPLPADIRGFAFGDPTREIAGTAATWEGGSCSSLGGGELRVVGSGPGEPWRLHGDGLDLTFTPAGESVELELAEVGLSFAYQLARVTGQLVRDGDELAVDCAGQRSHRWGAPDGKRFRALRVVSACFAADTGLIVLAARPRKARGHESDLMAGVLVEGGVPVDIFEPRLSSTYNAEGVPRRVGLELWIGDDDDEEAEHYTRRAAASAIGPWLPCGEATRSELLHWHMRGQEGVGVYELVEAP